MFLPFSAQNFRRNHGVQIKVVVLAVVAIFQQFCLEMLLNLHEITSFGFQMNLTSDHEIQMNKAPDSTNFIRRISQIIRNLIRKIYITNTYRRLRQNLDKINIITNIQHFRKYI